MSLVFNLKLQCKKNFSNLKALCLAILPMLVGWVFYLTIRGWDPTGIIDRSYLSPSNVLDNYWNIGNNLPSFLHAASIALLLGVSCKNPKTKWILWIMSTLGFEFLQAYSDKLGGFDIFDVVGIIMALPLMLLSLDSRTRTKAISKPSILLIGNTEDSSDATVSRANRSNKKHLTNHFFGFKTASQALTMTFGIVTSIATSGPYKPYDAYKTTHQPVCTPIAEFRAGFAVESPRPLQFAGRVYVQESLLIVSEPFKGLHLYDNSNPKSPMPVAFLRIPGNTDLAMKDNVIYADSAIDLLVIELKGKEASLLKRVENFLTVKVPSEFSKEHSYVSHNEIAGCEESGGVVTDYKKTENPE